MKKNLIFAVLLLGAAMLFAENDGERHHRERKEQTSVPIDGICRQERTDPSEDSPPLGETHRDSGSDGTRENPVPPEHPPECLETEPRQAVRPVHL